MHLLPLVLGVILLGTCALGSATPRATEAQISLKRELASYPEESDDPRLCADRARVHYYLGRFEGESAYVLGRADAKRALSLDKKNIAGRFWWAANQAGLARERKNLWALGALKEVEKELLSLTKDAGDYGGGAAFRLLGTLYDKAPTLVSIGSAERAEEYFRLAFERYPHVEQNRLLLVEFLVARGRAEEAKAIKQPRIFVGPQRSDPFYWDSLDWPDMLDTSWNQEERAS